MGGTHSFAPAPTPSSSLSLLDGAPADATTLAPLTGDDLLAAAEERALAGACGAPACLSRADPGAAARPKRLPALAGVPARDARFCGAACEAEVKRLAARLGGAADAAARVGLLAARAPARRAPLPSTGLAAGTPATPIMRATVVERDPGAAAPVPTPPPRGGAAAVEGYVPRSAQAMQAAAAAPDVVDTPRSARLRKTVSWRDGAGGGRLTSVRRVDDDGAVSRDAVTSSSDGDGGDEFAVGPGGGPSSSSSPPAAVVEFEVDGDAPASAFGRLKISGPAAPLDDALADLDLGSSDEGGGRGDGAFQDVESGDGSASSAPPSDSDLPDPPPLPSPDALAARESAHQAQLEADFAAWRARLAADDGEAPPSPAATAAPRRASSPRAPRRGRRGREPASPGTPERSLRPARGGSPVSPSPSDDERGERSDDGSDASAGAGPAAWAGPPLEGYTTTLSTFGGVAAALDAWVTDDTRALLAPPRAGAPPRARGGTIPPSLGAPLARALTPVASAMHVQMPRSTLDGAVGDVAATFSRVAVPALAEPQWAAVALVLAKALSLHRVPALAPAFEGRDAVSRASGLLSRLGLTLEGFAALLDIVVDPMD